MWRTDMAGAVACSGCFARSRLGLEYPFQGLWLDMLGNLAHWNGSDCMLEKKVDFTTLGDGEGFLVLFRQLPDVVNLLCHREKHEVRVDVHGVVLDDGN